MAVKKETAAAVGIENPVQATNMVNYSNAILGLSFDYPAELGEVEFKLGEGETGYAWGLGFSRFDALYFAGRSRDFSEGRGAMEGDTLGFFKDEHGRYYWRTIPAPNGMEIDVDDVFKVDGREVVLFRPPPLWGEQDGEEESAVYPIRALVNLSGDRFPGFIVLPYDTERLPLETLRAILQSIRVEEPWAPPSTSTPGAW